MMVTLLLPLGSATESAEAQSVYPGESWQTSSDPERLGWSVERLRLARAYADGINTAAVMIIQGGTVVYEWGETTRRDFNAAGANFEQETGRGIFEAFDELIARPTGMQDYGPRDGMYEPRSGFGGAQGRTVSDFPAYVCRLSARDMARFGLLYLRSGRWNDRQVIPEEWVERTTHTDRAIGDYGGYEFFWWISIGGRLYPGVDVGAGAYAAHGAGGHYITIMPAHDLVVVHRVNTNDRTVPVGGTEAGTSVSATEYGKLLGLILDSRN